MDSSRVSKRLIVGSAVTIVVVAIAAAVFALSTWGEVNRVSIDRPNPAPASDGPTAASEEPDEESGESSTAEPVASSHGLEVVLLVGSDSREGLDDLTGFSDVDGNRADVVLVLFRTESRTAVLSLPRDLWVEDPCSGEFARLNDMLEGCGDDLNGPTLLTITVEKLIGETIDHFAMVDLVGFENVVDAIGGYEICVDLAVRDRKSNLELPGGCTMASGDQTLAWMRSRSTQQLTESGWRVVPGVNDLARNERQRQFLIEMMGRLSDFTSPQSLAMTAQAVAPFVTVDSELTLVDAVDLAWAMRGMGTGAVQELDVRVLDFTTEYGAQVLIAEIPIDDVVAGFVSPETAQDDDLTATG